MGLARFENKLEQFISGVFARAFRSAVQPVEISAALQREVDHRAKVISRDRRLVPNEFTVSLAPSDLERLREYDAAMAGEFSRQLKEYAREQGYVFPGPVSIAFDGDESLTTGRVQVHSAAKAQVTARETTTPRRAHVTLEINGTRHAVVPPGVVIGRGTDADLRINDPGISRRHAEILVRELDGETLVGVRDLGSTNGLLVDGIKTAQARVHDGAQISLGNTRVVIHIEDDDLDLAESGYPRPGDAGR
ncbi:MAG: DUF3662 and FHA domain-containing protein [Nocardioides sp.]|jgi:hypothetical protein